MKFFDSYSKRGNGKPCRVRDKISNLKKMANWQIYQNLGGDSDVEKFLIDNQSITIKFRKSKFLYLYNSTTTGTLHIKEMIELAKSGSGLGSYINSNVKDKYAEKLA